jgi:DNA-directed RNA polymerase III subunit RPC5
MTIIQQETATERLVEELHLSPITGVIQMRPQFHHLDAKAQLAKARQARDRAANEPARATESRIVQQSARTAADDEELNIAKTSAFLTNASEESWIPLDYHDEDVSF